VVVIVVLTLNKSPRNSKNVATVGYDVSIAPSQPPSASPTTTSTFAELLSTLESLYESCDGAENFATVFANESSPQHLAASWAADSASIVGINGDDVRMINRFALATLYFATNGDEWYMCGRGSTFCDASQEWLTGENECDWHAIGCEDDDFHITDIFFPTNGEKSNNIRGTLPYELSFLPRLAVFIISRGPISGPFPDWSDLSTLEHLVLNNHEFT